MSSDRHEGGSVLEEIAERAGVRVIGPLAGGEFGATLVADEAGRELVLKSMPSTRWERNFARGASLANHLRASGYPAPRYVSTGVAANATWSLQERLPGAVPDVVTVGHMGQLLALAERHAGAAPEPRKDAWLAGQLPYLEDSLSRIVGDGRTRPLALELSAVLANHDAVALLNNGIVHSDFHHRNFLALDDEVTAVFDWEFASVGDWRYDLVTLAFWSVLIPWQIPPDVADIAVARMRDRCPADLRALLTAVRAINQLDYDLRTKPDSLDSFVERVEREVAPWWRAAG